MSNLKIEEKFIVEAPIAQVWQFVLSPELVAGCLPGAQLRGQDGADTYLGTMKIKVGPVTSEFKGKATMSDIDPTTHRLKLSGTGDDVSGGGSARMTMELSVVEAAGGSEVQVVADVELAGKLVRFGRGMIEGVSKQLFKQFVERARERILSPASAAAPTNPDAATPPTAAAPVEPEAAPATENEAKPAAEAEVKPAAGLEAKPAAEAEAKPTATAKPKAADETAEEPAGKGSAAAAPSRGAPPPPEASDITTGVLPRPKPRPLAIAVPQEEPEALDAGALVWRTLWEWIRGLFRRLLGRSK